MGLIQLNQWGEWNPQLFRELKGRLTRRNLLLGVATSLVVQFLVLLFCSQQTCISSECVQLERDIDWHTVSIVLSWLLPFLLLFGGIYLLLCDLGKEEARGTLNFIRLSPQPSESILTGKILGVPALLYLSVALAIPLHAGSALVDGFSWNLLLGIYTLWGIGCCLCYTSALLLAFVNRNQGGVQAQAWAGSGLGALFGVLYIGVINSSFDLYQSSSGLGEWHWFLLPLGYQPGLAYIWMLISTSVGTYWIWQAANRLFRNPKATLLSKSQSYWLVGSFQVWLLGFVLPELKSVPSESQLFLGCSFLFALNPIWFLILSAALSPHRQSLQNWACYRSNRGSTNKERWNHLLLQDLVWGEKSPALGAIAINLLITSIIWVPWILLWPQEVLRQENFTIQEALLGLLLTVNLILIYAAIAELLSLLNPTKSGAWITGIAGVVIILVWGMYSLLGIEPLEIPFLWLLSPLPILTLVHASATQVFLGLLGQLSILGLLTLQLTRQLQKLGESPSKALFTKHLSLPPSGLK